MKDASASTVEEEGEIINSTPLRPQVVLVDDEDMAETIVKVPLSPSKADQLPPLSSEWFKEKKGAILSDTDRETCLSMLDQRTHTSIQGNKFHLASIFSLQRAID